MGVFVENPWFCPGEDIVKRKQKVRKNKTLFGETLINYNNKFYTMREKWVNIGKQHTARQSAKNLA